MRFPVTIRYRASKAKIYAPQAKFGYYRIAYVVQQAADANLHRYSDAREAAERVVRELAKGSQAAALTATQSRDALAALERLQAFYQSTGRRLSLLAGISEYCEAASKFSGSSLSEAVDGYLNTVANVQRRHCDSRRGVHHGRGAAHKSG